MFEKDYYRTLNNNRSLSTSVDGFARTPLYGFETSNLEINI